MKTTVELFYTNVDALREPALYQRHYRALPAHRRAHVDQLRFDKDKRLSVGAWALLDHALASVGIEAARAELAFGSHGKPRLATKEVWFNLSHAGSRALCALCRTCEVGCDIEAIEHCQNIRVARICMQPEEQAIITATDDPWEQAHTFCRLWTLKESYIKAIGRGLSCDPRSFRMALSDDPPTIFSDEAGFDANVSFQEVPIDEAYACSVCARADALAVEVTPVELA